jgi:hypothetical protein
VLDDRVDDCIPKVDILFLQMCKCVIAHAV